MIAFGNRYLAGHLKNYKQKIINFSTSYRSKPMFEDNNNDNSNKNSKPVTVIVKRIAKKDKIKEFEEWLSGISKEVSRQEGSMGIDIIRPSDNLNTLSYSGSIIIIIL